MILRLVDQPLAEAHKDHVQWTPRSSQAHALAAERQRFRLRLRLRFSAISSTVPSQTCHPRAQRLKNRTQPCGTLLGQVDQWLSGCCPMSVHR